MRRDPGSAGSSWVRVMWVRRFALALGLCLWALLSTSAPSWAAVTCTPPQVVSADGLSCVDPPPSPSASPAPSPSSAPTAPTSVELSEAQFSTVAFGLGLLVFLSAAGVVAGWRR